MGCCSSVEAEAAHRRNRPPQKNDGNKQQMQGRQLSGQDSRGNTLARFEQIVSGAKMISAPSNMMPIVCLTQHAFPLITSFLHLEDSTPTDIQLPIVAGSILENGRIICFAQLQFLSSKALHTADTAKLITNSLNWLSGGVSSMTPVLVLGFDKSTTQYVMKALQDLTFFAEAGSKKSNFANYKCVVIPSNIPLDDNEFVNNIIEYVRNGGGLAVFYIHVDISQPSMPINKLLSPFGLSFTYCLLNEDLEDADNIQVPPAFTYVRDSNFVPILAHFKAVVKQNNIDTSTLDDLVTTLRYYIMVCDESYSEQLLEISNYSWDFLKRTEYSSPQGICPDIKHGIVVVLLQDLYAKLPIDKVEPIPEHDIFPGKTGDVQLTEFTLTLKVRDDAWISTGLWLPASVSAVVETETPNLDIHIQIGSQHDSLLTKQGPWKRWPSVVSIFQLDAESINVGTPFGGIVYITLTPPEPVDPFEITFTFKNFCQHPLAVVSNPAIWNQTKDIDVPWGELDAGDIIFTLPSDKLRAIPDFEKIKKVFDVIINGISNYMSHALERPYRFVFDVEITDSEEQWFGYGYPLVFHIDEINGILFDIDNPTPELFKAVSMMTVTSIREDCFDNTTEKAIANVATAVIFQELYPNFNPFSFNGIKLPTLFNELWEIHSNCDPELIPQTLAKFQNPEYPVSEVPEDMWIAFVREMCRIGKRDFTKLLERSRPIPLNISISLQGLPPYQPTSTG